MITFSNKNHVNKKNEKKNDRRWMFTFPRFEQKKTPEKQGANWNMALGVEHIYQLWKKTQETAATGWFLFWAYAGWCFSNRDICFDIQSNEIYVLRSKSLTIESPEEGRCSSYKTKSGGKLCALHPLENLSVPPHPRSPLIQRWWISLFILYFSNISFGWRLDEERRHE